MFEQNGSYFILLHSFISIMFEYVNHVQPCWLLFEWFCFFLLDVLFSFQASPVPKWKQFRATLCRVLSSQHERLSPALSDAGISPSCSAHSWELELAWESSFSQILLRLHRIDLPPTRSWTQNALESQWLLSLHQSAAHRPAMTGLHRAAGRSDVLKATCWTVVFRGRVGRCRQSWLELVCD